MYTWEELRDYRSIWRERNGSGNGAVLMMLPNLSCFSHFAHFGEQIGEEEEHGWILWRSWKI